MEAIHRLGGGSLPRSGPRCRSKRLRQERLTRARRPRDTDDRAGAPRTEECDRLIQQGRDSRRGGLARHGSSAEWRRAANPLFALAGFEALITRYMGRGPGTTRATERSSHVHHRGQARLLKTASTAHAGPRARALNLYRVVVAVSDQGPNAPAGWYDGPTSGQRLPARERRHPGGAFGPSGSRSSLVR
jgi:hypothetical protein